MRPLTGLHKAIKYFGSQENFAKVLGVSRSTIGHWLNGVRNLPDFYVVSIFSLTKGTIPLSELSHSHQRIYQLAESLITFSNTPAIQVLIKEIEINNVYCPIYKDCEDLLACFNPQNLYQPIFIDEQNKLITCECRLRANILLGKKYIHAHPLNLSEIIEGDSSLVALIKTLPVSEKVAIGMAIERELGNRQGKKNSLTLVDKYPQVSIGLKTRAIAAKAAGFNSDFIYRQAKIVIAHGTPELVQMMDNEGCAPSRASQVAGLSRDEQYQYVLKLNNQHKNFVNLFTGDSHGQNPYC